MWDVIVVGAGAAGLLAGIRAAERNLRTLLLEKNRKPAVKILMSGGTRCNITQATDAKGIVAAYGPPGKFLHSALAALSPQDVVELFHAEGVPTKVEPTGKIFPISDRALDVQQALLRRLARSGAKLVTETPVVAIRHSDHGFEVVGQTQSWFSKNLILTTGGMSYPGCGTTGDGYAWAQTLTHTIHAPRPALVPITSDTAWIRNLSGVTLPDVVLRVREPDRTKPGTVINETVNRGKRDSQDLIPGRVEKIPGTVINETVNRGKRDSQALILGRVGNKPLAEGRGSLLFTHFGLSGPVVLNISRTVTEHSAPASLMLECDLLPQQNEADLQRQLQNVGQTAGNQLVLTQWAEHLPRRVVETLFMLADIALSRKCSEFSKPERARLIAATKRLAIPISGTLGFEKAEVTAGGVSLTEVDSRTMQSRRVPNLYFAGEILDLDGPIGGYNFQAAFSTGWLAGSSVRSPTL